MGREPVELRFVYNNQNDCTALVQTGIYVFNTSTLDQVAELAFRREEIPDYVEVPLDQFKDWIVPKMKEKNREIE